MIKWEKEQPADDLAVPCHSLVIGGVLCRWWGETEPEGAQLLTQLANINGPHDQLQIDNGALRSNLARLAMASDNDEQIEMLRSIMQGAARCAAALYAQAVEREEPTTPTVRDRYRMAALTGLLAGTYMEGATEPTRVAVNRIADDMMNLKRQD